jgi:hypothetical protein
MNLEWMLIRGTGLVAYLMLAASTIWGLALSSKLFIRIVKAKPLTWLHEGLAVGALLATGAHLFFLWSDDFVEFGPRELLVPGASTWEPLAVAFGIVAFYAALVVSVSFYVKKWIGQAAWRTIHFLAFGTFAAAALHGVMAGTDTQHPAVLSMYVATVALVVLLLVVRVGQEMAMSVKVARPERRMGEETAPMRREGSRPIPTQQAPVHQTTDAHDRLAALQARRAGAGGD